MGEPSLSRGSRSLPWIAAAAALPALALFQADRAGAAGATVLGGLDPFFRAAIGAGDLLLRGGGGAISALRLPAALILLAWLAARARRSAPLGDGARLLAALALAALGQAWLPDAGAVGLALYAGAVPALLWRRVPPSPLAATVPRQLEGMAGLALLALFLAGALHQLDLYPDLYFDEIAYLRAARIEAGLLDSEVVVRTFAGQPMYRLEQLRAQALPLGLHTAFAHLTTPTPLSTRLASVLAVYAALVAAALALRRRLGSLPALGMLALCAWAPLALGHARQGHYMPVSILHGALAFAAVLWVQERWDRRSGAVLGALLGASLYNYQLSWCVPLLAGAALLASPDPWRRPEARRALTVAGALALVALLPALWLSEGLRLVSAQTFDRASWNRSLRGDGEGSSPIGVVILEADAEPEGIDAIAAELGGHGVSVEPVRGSSRRPLLVLHGESAAVQRALSAAAARSLDVLEFIDRLEPLHARALRMARQLARGPAWEASGRWIDAPLLNPLVTPLCFAGLLAAFRRRREPAPRALAVWVIGAALVPAALGGAAPRRAALLVPLVYAVASLPLAELAAAARPAGARARAAAALLLPAFLVAVAFTDLALYRERWDQRVGPSPLANALEVARAIARVPPGEAVLLPPFAGRLRLALELDPDVEGYREIVPVRGMPSAARYRAAACAQAPPFTWLVGGERDPANRAARQVLERHFHFGEERAGRYRLLRATSSRPGGCDPLSSPPAPG